jgi:hypothetical protein
VSNTFNAPCLDHSVDEVTSNPFVSSDWVVEVKGEKRISLGLNLPLLSSLRSSVGGVVLM